MDVITEKPITRYCGRFAPSPTGPLHAGSLVAALASWLDARANGGRWFLRIEDVDVPRSVPGAADQIRRQLLACGLEWDDEVPAQRVRTQHYQAALETLLDRQHAYACACTRKQLEGQPLASDGARRYPGTCREGLPAGIEGRAIRFKVQAGELCFDDRWLGMQCLDVSQDCGDFVLLRADGWFAYQLAVVVDDAEQGVTHVVRGRDLLTSTPRQIQLLQALSYIVPSYMHVPLVLNAAGEKLSKQTQAPALVPEQASKDIYAAMKTLQLPMADDLERWPVAEQLGWAIQHWPHRA